jgi:molecular chaperone GrpE
MTEETTTENEEINNVEELNAEQVEAEVAPEVELVEEVAEESSEEKLTKEVKEWKDKYFYAAAEFQNTQKRAEREKDNLLKYGSEKILRDLLGVADNLERTVTSIRDDDDEKIKNIVVGIEMVQKSLIDSLSKNGLKKVESLGKVFDPNFHDAMSQMESADHESNEIIQVFEDGYELNGRLLRAAKVIIAK